MRDMAEELLRLYAQPRRCRSAFHPTRIGSGEFEAAFRADADQATAIADIKHDMEEATPMDRLLCGDVGYGRPGGDARCLQGEMMARQPRWRACADHAVPWPFSAKTLRDRLAVRRDQMVSRFRTKPETTGIPAGVASGRIVASSSGRTGCCRTTSLATSGLLVVGRGAAVSVAHEAHQADAQARDVPDDDPRRRFHGR
jgi:transcription-repair coupling factor (superfamily II helicase)